MENGMNQGLKAHMLPGFPSGAGCLPHVECYIFHGASLLRRCGRCVPRILWGVTLGNNMTMASSVLQGCCLS